MSTKVSEIEKKCNVIKDISFFVAGGIITFLCTMLTTCINNSHLEKMENSKNIFSYIQEYSKNYLLAVNCERDIINKAKIFGRNLNIKADSKDTHESFMKYSKAFDVCKSELFKMKLISTAINLNTEGVDCALDHLTLLNDKIIHTKELLEYVNPNADFHSEMAYDILKSNNVWANCLNTINTNLLSRSKNILL